MPDKVAPVPAPVDGPTLMRRSQWVQLFWRPPYPISDFSHRVVIVTGANIGLGKWAAYHFARLGAARVIVGSRSLSRGEEAVREINTYLPPERQHVCEVWQLDLSSYANTKAFAKRVTAELPRLDHVVLNASIATADFEKVEQDESTVTVNVVSTFLLALLVLPKLRETSANTSGQLRNAAFPPSLSITGSSFHVTSQLKAQRGEESIFDALSDPARATMDERYPASKLLQLMVVREMARRMPMQDRLVASVLEGGAERVSQQPRVVLNILNPGLNKTALTRNMSGLQAAFMYVFKAIFGWEAEEGSRTLVHGAVAGPESHGGFLSESSLWNESLSDFVPSEEGVRTQKKVWSELVQKLEKIEPGVTEVLK